MYSCNLALRHFTPVGYLLFINHQVQCALFTDFAIFTAKVRHFVISESRLKKKKGAYFHLFCAFAIAYIDWCSVYSHIVIDK